MEFLHSEALIRLLRIGFPVLAVAWAVSMHGAHPCDTAFDVTTGVRFHPLEIALPMGVKLGVQDWREPGEQGPVSLLLNPFRSPAPKRGPGAGRASPLEKHEASDA